MKKYFSWKTANVFFLLFVFIFIFWVEEGNYKQRMKIKKVEILPFSDDQNKISYKIESLQQVSI